MYPLAPPLYIQPTAGAIAPRPPMLPPALCRFPAGMVMFAGPHMLQLAHHPAVTLTMMRPPFIHISQLLQIQDLQQGIRRRASGSLCKQMGSSPRHKDKVN